jgi:Ca2+ transporting ATPase
LVGTATLQALIVQFGGDAMHVVSGGLPASYWGLSLLLGFGSLVVQQVINVIFRLAVNSKQKLRQRQRYKRDRALVGKHTSDTHLHRD